MSLFSFDQLLRNLTLDLHYLSLALMPIGLHANKQKNKRVCGQGEEIPPFFNYTATGDVWGEHVVVSTFSYLQI